MFDSAPRLILGAVALCVLVSLLAVLRTREVQEEVSPRRPLAQGPARHAGPTARFSGGGIDGSVGTGETIGSSKRGDGTLAGPAPRELGAAGANTAASREGRRLVTEPAPQLGIGAVGTPRLLGSGAGALGAAGSAEEELLRSLPPGTILAAPLKGSAESLDHTQPLIEENVYYDGDEGAYFPPDARLAYPDKGGVRNEAGTIAFWVQPGWRGPDPTDNSFVQLHTHEWSNRLHVFKNGVYLRFLFTDNTGIEHGVGLPINWAPGEWHHVAATWGDQITTLYVDGVPVGQDRYSGQLEIPVGTPLYVGSDVPQGTPGADAVLRGFYVNERALAPQEIQELTYFGP